MPQSDKVRPDYNRACKMAAKYTAAVTKPPVPIREIVEREGLDVKFVRFNTLSGEIEGFTKFKERTIYVNSERKFNRQTFTIAHEFGHWVLHRELFEKDPDRYHVLLRVARRINADYLEKEANTFAANILVPVHLLKPVKDVAKISELAIMFSVSEEVIELRLKYV